VAENGAQVTHRYGLQASAPLSAAAITDKTDDETLGFLVEPALVFDECSAEPSLSAYAAAYVKAAAAMRDHPGYAADLDPYAEVKKHAIFTNTKTQYNVFVCASGQVPIMMLPPDLPASKTGLLGTLTMAYGKTDDRGLIPPPVQPQQMPDSRTRSLGDVSEPFVRYLRDLDEVLSKLHQRRGSDSQEHLMFDVVAPFLLSNGAMALSDVDMELETLPASARYFFPYLLGHLKTDDRAMLRARTYYLSKYIKSTDADIREGAEEALDHLNAA
jgi:hypothetical protein